MKIVVQHDIDAPPHDVLEWVSDLARFPHWTKVLYRVFDEPVDGPRRPDAPRAWQVELRGKIGPFARSKRLRMVEEPTGTDGHIRFRRQEIDATDHGTWILDVKVERGRTSASSHLTAVFEYDGRLWSAAVERLLRDEIESSKRRLSELVATAPQSGDQAT